MSSVPTRVRRLRRSGSMATEAPPTPSPLPEEEEEQIQPSVFVDEEQFLPPPQPQIGEDEDFFADLKNPPLPREEPQMLNNEDDFFADLKNESAMPPPQSPKKGGGRKKKLPPQDDDELPYHPALRHLTGERPSKKKDANLYSSKPTPIMGDKRNALMKIQQYKALFPDIPQVKAFKIKPNATEAELDAAVSELEGIASCNSLQAMCDEMVLACVRVVENITAKTNGTFDCTGTADMLKLNPDFHRLCRVLTIKYSVFANVPPETQLLMIIMSTAMVCVQKNRASGEIRGMLNQPF